VLVAALVVFGLVVSGLEVEVVLLVELVVDVAGAVSGAVAGSVTTVVDGAGASSSWTVL
jgi:hypothetical protein